MKKTNAKLCCTFLALCLTILPASCGDSAGAFWIEDWMRDLFFGPALAIGGDLALALLLPGATGPAGPVGAAGPEGPAGSTGTTGPVGSPLLFDIFVDDFFSDTANPSGNFPVNTINITEPVLGQVTFNHRLAFRVLIPSEYTGTNAVVMRIALRRIPPPPALPTGNPFAFEIFGRRLQNGSTTIENYVNPPSRIITPTAPAGGFVDTEFILLDIPINVAFPAGLGGAAIVAGDFLAFELQTTSTDLDPAARYLILGVEFFETTAAPTVAGATIS